LADQIFEPAMMPGGVLASTFEGVVGVGLGSGMSLMFVFTGVAGVAVGLVGYLIPVVRNLEDILPDYEAVAVPT
jgi:hypothetical protein